MLILRPFESGVTIHKDDQYQVMKGDPIDCCKRIKNYVIYEGKQIMPIALEVFSSGILFADFFNSNGIDFTILKHDKIIP